MLEQHGAYPGGGGARERPDLRDYLLATLHYAGGRLPTKTHLMKILAAFARLTGLEDFFDFAPYRMGLYSGEVDLVLAELRGEGLIDTRRGPALTSRGSREAARAAARLEAYLPDEARLLQRLARSLRRLRTDELLLLHYVLYCDEKCRSVSEEWRRIKGRRAEIALQMLRRGAASWRLAARLAGMEPGEFLRYARRRGVQAGDTLEPSDLEAGKEDAKHLRTRLLRSSDS